MEVIIEPTSSTPFVRISKESGKFEIRGKSHAEDSLGFYLGVIHQLKELGNSGDKIEAAFCLEYFNTASAKCLYDIFKYLKSLEKSGSEVLVNWYHEDHDEDMLETGEDYSMLTGLKFNYIGLSENDLTKLAYNK